MQDQYEQQRVDQFEGLNNDSQMRSIMYSSEGGDYYEDDHQRHLETEMTAEGQRRELKRKKPSESI